VATARPEEIAKFTMFTTKPTGRFIAFEAKHAADPAFDAPMVLFKMIVVGVLVPRLNHMSGGR
jgi:hypothetical protein